MFPYASQADFILKHGRGFEWRALPPGVRMGTARQCFRNSVRLALEKPRSYTYVDGYAIKQVGPSASSGARVVR